MIDNDYILRRRNGGVAITSPGTRSISLPASRYTLQEVIILPPPYTEEEVVLPPPYTEEYIPLPPPLTTLSVSSLQVGGGVISLGLEAVSGIERNEYLLMFTYSPVNRRARFSFSPICVGINFFSKFVALLVAVFFLGVVDGVGRDVVEPDGHCFFATLSASIAFFLLGMVAGYCRKVTSASSY
ncbi:hypothetical protein [Candidatus Ichthyocystis hellenicum]|uniref:hypothetical protein n=1 Tax=Candidatus Ichthyocystis hellenicum TaxID=1561003 RepID=UPI000B84A0F0|nr:hypothetical protein [Candidatus Ichthyocystis hellenicum]